MDRIAVSVEEAAESLGISRAHAFRLVERGELPTIRLGKRILVPIDRLQKLLQADQPPLATAGR
jgi:excisionase family DNA binding protein